MPEGGQTIIAVTPEKEVLCDRPKAWFRVRLDEVEIVRTKKRFEYTVAEIGPSVGIIALDEEEKITIVGQWRYTLSKYSWEIPTGIVDQGESVLEAAKRELREEAGLIAKDWTKLGTIDNSNGATTDVGHLFLASGLTKVDRHPGENEVIELGSIDLWRAVELVYKNEITESLSVGAILKAAHYVATETG